MRTILGILATAAATAVAAWLVPGITVGGADLQQQAITLVLVALVIGLVNAFVKPLAQFVTGCLIVVTLGLFLLVINALMLMLAAWISGQLGLDFAVDGFWSALFGSIIISLVSGLINGIFNSARSDQR